MISEDIKERFAAIVSGMNSEQKRQLMEHLENATPEQKEDAILKIVARYDRKANEETYNSHKTQDTADSPNTEKTSSSQGQIRRLKKSVKRAIAGIIAAAAVILGASIILANKDRIWGSSGTPTDNIIQNEAFPEQVIEPEQTVATSTPTPAPTATPTPAPTIVPLAENAPDLSGLKIVIDPGHQETADLEEETYSLWSSATKPKVTSGTTGIASGIPEYELTLEYALIIRDYLEQCGAEVLLTRESNDVDISNQERALFATENDADLFIRIHADAAGDSETSGVRVYIPDSGSYADTSPSLAQELAELISQAEGLNVNDVRSTGLYTGLNYAGTIRSFQISLGFLSNSDDEEVLLQEDNPSKVAQAISVFCAEFI